MYKPILLLPPEALDITHVCRHRSLVSCACWNSHVTWRWPKLGFLIVTMTSLTAAALILPYLTIIIRRMMPPILPFISQSGGEPPTSGIFCICLMVADFAALVFFPLLYTSINQRNVNNSKFVRLANKWALGLSLIGCAGAIVLVSFPIGYTEVPNKFLWLVTVLTWHSFGATMVLFGQTFYQIVYTAISWYLPDVSKTDRYIRTAFVFGFIIIFMITVYPMPAFLVEILGSSGFDIEALKKDTYVIPKEYSTNYLISSFCEWTICILSIIYFATMYKDLQSVSLRVVLRHKSCLAEIEPPSPSIPLTVIS